NDVGAGGELIDVCSYPSQSPNSNPSDCVITPPNCSTDADCDDHNPCTVDMCATGTGGVKFCNNMPGNAGTVCRASADACDVAETCTGSSASCPADAFQSAGTVCRASAGPCDVAETCTGSSASCPADGFQSAGTVCRASAGACDVAESCTGTSANCPPDQFKSTDVVCRPSAGDCDVAESCTGTSANCPPDGFQASSMVCRQVYCPGTGTTCP